MMHWDELDVLDSTNNVLRAAVPATVYVKSHGIESSDVGSDGTLLLTQLRATVEPDVAIAVDNRVVWRGDLYRVTGVVPVNAKGVVRHQTVELSRAIG